MKKGIVVLGAFLAFVMVNCEGDNAQVEGVVETPEVEEVVDTPEMDSHTSETALDWAGTYGGSRPCADCEALETELTITKEKEYILVEKYKGKSDEEIVRKGRFSFDSTGSQLRFEGEEFSRIKLVENGLVFLDAKGEEIKGDTEKLYVLNKKGKSLTQTEWQLVEFRGQTITDSITQLVPTLMLDTLNNRATGNASCNQYSGTYTTDGMFLLHFDQMIATKKGCLGANIEQEYLSTLSKVDNYKITNNTLSLNKGKMATLMKFVAIEK